MSASSKRPRANPMTAVNRLKMDYIRLKKDPIPYIEAEPLPSNLLEWHYAVTGPEKTPYYGGCYHGKLVFPSEFPFKPPSIYILTPNGRFKCDTRLCLSISDYHPDTWNPAWSVSSILTGLLSFMLETSQTVGSIETSENEKRKFAAYSHEFNLKNKIFIELFPKLAKNSKKIVEYQKTNCGQVQPASNSHSRDDYSNVSIMRRQLDQNNHGFQAAVTNALVIGGFAAFAFIVRYILQSLACATTEN